MKFNIPDYLSNLDSQSFGKKILYLPETKSTNDDIWENFNNDHLIIITDNQTAGKGQRGREWISQQFKSLTFSIGILDDNKNSKLISLKSAISIAKTINDLTSLDALIKWPNDILINNKKVAGILTESKIKNNKRIINIGIGINVNNESNELENVDQPATSLMIESNNKFSREILLANLIKCIDSILYKNNMAIINDWNKLCAHKNTLITFHNYKNKLIKGKFIGIDKEGRAIIDINGKLSYYLNGELTL
tara:strand:+ start:1608 stop:2357 length:750 start_codon:yes stop_codon:yes gene_type:complete